MADSFSLDVDSCEDVPTVLKTAADDYRITAAMVELCQEERQLGLWAALADILDHAAESCRKAIEEHKKP